MKNLPNHNQGGYFELEIEKFREDAGFLQLCIEMGNTAEQNGITVQFLIMFFDVLSAQESKIANVGSRITISWVHFSTYVKHGRLF